MSQIASSVLVYFCELVCTCTVSERSQGSLIR